MATRRTADRSVAEVHSYRNGAVTATVSSAPLNGLRDRIRREEEEGLRFRFREFGEAVQWNCISLAQARLNGGTRSDDRRAGGPWYADSFHVKFYEPLARHSTTEWKIVVYNDAEMAHILENGHVASYPIPLGSGPKARLAWPTDNVNPASGWRIVRKSVIWYDKDAGSEHSASNGYHILRDAVDLAHQDFRQIGSDHRGVSKRGGSNRSRVAPLLSRSNRF